MRRCLQEIGFAEELRHRDFYDVNESQIIYGLRLRGAQHRDTGSDHRQIRFTDIDEIGETNDAYWLSWELDESASRLQKQDFQPIIDQVRQWGGRCLFVAFPGGIPAVDDLVRSLGFRGLE
ncbi:MAG: hypothetical protein R3C05_07485 [Pirellulaceae bacterium]